MKRDEIVRAAIELENDGRKFYLDAAAKTDDAQTRRIFESLADDELHHLDWIKQNLPQTESAGELNRALYGRLRGIFAEPPEETRRRAAASADDIAVFKLGIEMEEKSRAAYMKWAEEGEDAEQRELCGKLADIERFHREVLEKTIEYLERTADWFMQEEHWNFEGG